MPIEITPYDSSWPILFDQIADSIRAAIAHIPNASIEHVGSTSVPGLAAKPILDIDVIVDREQIPAGIAALESIGYTHRGDLGVPGREAFLAPDERPERHVYLCERGCLSVRNHLAVRDILRQQPDLRDDYAAVKLALASDPTIDIDTYVEGKSDVLQQILALADNITPEERESILGVNAQARPAPPHDLPMSPSPNPNGTSRHRNDGHSSRSWPTAFMDNPGQRCATRDSSLGRIVLMWTTTG